MTNGDKKKKREALIGLLLITALVLAVVWRDQVADAETVEAIRGAHLDGNLQDYRPLSCLLALSEPHTPPLTAARE